MRKKSLIICTLVVCLALWSCETKPDIQMGDVPPVPVKAALPLAKDITVYLEAIGIFKPSILMEVRPQVDGKLVEVLVSEGQWVAEAAPLFIIDPNPYIIKVQEVEAQLTITQANLNAAQKKLDRIKPLAEKDLIARIEWDDLETENQKLKASLDLDKARLKSCQLELEHCTIHAPHAGRIGKLDAHPGLLVARGQAEPLVTISKMNPLIVEFNVTEKEFAKIPRDLGQIDIQLLCDSDACTSGSITFLDNHFDAKTGLLLVRGTVQNSDYTLRPGQSVQVRIPIATTANAKLIPQKAIRYNQQGPYVYVVKPDQTVEIRQLILGEEQGVDQVVLEGVDSEEQLIIDGHLRLSPGLKVEIKS